MKKRERKFKFAVTYEGVTKYVVSRSREGAVKQFFGKERIPGLYVDKFGNVEAFKGVTTEIIERVY